MHIQARGGSVVVSHQDEICPCPALEKRLVNWRAFPVQVAASYIGLVVQADHGASLSGGDREILLADDEVESVLPLEDVIGLVVALRHGDQLPACNGQLPAELGMCAPGDVL